MINNAPIITAIIGALTSAPFNLTSLGAGNLTEAQADYLTIHGVHNEHHDGEELSGTSTGQIMTYTEANLAAEVVATLPPAPNDADSQGWQKAEAYKISLMEAILAVMRALNDADKITAYKIGQVVIMPHEGDKNKSRFVFQFNLVYYMQ